MEYYNNSATKIIALNPGHQNMKKNTLQSLLEIINDFNREIEKNPEFADAFCSRGMLKYSLDDIKGAFMDWTTAIELGRPDAFLLIRNSLTISR